MEDLGDGRAGAAPVGVAVVGLGTIGSFHAAALAAGSVPGGRLVAACDVDGGRVVQFGHDCGHDARTSDDVADVLADGRVEAVVVATPHFEHVPVATAALAAGRHVLVEKPLAPHVRACREILAARTDEGQVLAVMFNERVHPAYRRLREIVRGGALGPIRRIVWIATDWFRTDAYYRSSPWRATWRGEGGGVLLNQSPHQLDLWQWMFGMPARVTAFCRFGRYHDIEVEDDVTAHLEYDDGCVGLFVTTTGEAPGIDRLEVTGDRGRAVVERGTGTITLTRNSVGAAEFAATSDGHFVAPPTTEDVIAVDDPGGHHAAVLADFCRAVRDGRAPLAPAEEAVASVELANAMLASTWAGAPVDLPLDGDAYAARLQALARG